MIIIVNMIIMKVGVVLYQRSLTHYHCAQTAAAPQNVIVFLLKITLFLPLLMDLNHHRHHRHHYDHDQWR